MGRHQKQLPFGAFFARYLVILYLMEAYDILFFDWVLLCHSNFFPHFYPEVKGIAAPQLFGYNKKVNYIAESKHLMKRI